VVEGGIQKATRETMKNIFRGLKKYSTSPEKIVKCTIFLASMNEWGAINLAYIEALGSHRPARSALGASGLTLNSKVQIKCILIR
jgi:2-iminobutanoate/2-iminopropanoate deaminase